MVEVRAGVDAYQGAAWVREYIRELNTSYRFVWQSYVYWRCSPYQGRYVNVHRNGLRATWNPPPVRVFTFGAYTVASYRRLAPE